MPRPPVLGSFRRAQDSILCVGERPPDARPSRTPSHHRWGPPGRALPWQRPARPRSRHGHVRPAAPDRGPQGPVQGAGRTARCARPDRGTLGIDAGGGVGSDRAQSGGASGPARRAGRGRVRPGLGGEGTPHGGPAPAPASAATGRADRRTPKRGPLRDAGAGARSAGARGLGLGGGGGTGGEGARGSCVDPGSSLRDRGATRTGDAALGRRPPYRGGRPAGPARGDRLRKPSIRWGVARVLRLGPGRPEEPGLGGRGGGGHTPPVPGQAGRRHGPPGAFRDVRRDQSRPSVRR